MTVWMVHFRVRQSNQAVTSLAEARLPPMFERFFDGLSRLGAGATGGYVDRTLVTLGQRQFTIRTHALECEQHVLYHITSCSIGRIFRSKIASAFTADQDSASMNIKSFACTDTEKLFNDERASGIPVQIAKRARKKMLLIHASMM